MDYLGMILKSFNIDMNEMKATAAEYVKSIKATIDYFVGRFNKSDEALARIETKIDALSADRLNSLLLDHDCINGASDKKSIESDHVRH